MNLDILRLSSAQLTRLSFVPPQCPHLARLLGSPGVALLGLCSLGATVADVNSPVSDCILIAGLQSSTSTSGPQQAVFVAAVSTSSPLPAAADEKAG